MPLTIAKVNIVLARRSFIICASCYDTLHRLWKNFSAACGLPKELHTNVFDALHQLKKNVLQIQAVDTELQRIEAKRKIEFALQRIKEFATFILRYRTTAETSHDIGITNLNISDEAIYLQNLLMRLTRG